MSFLGPKLLLKIDSRLRQAFPHRQHEPFGGVSIILVGDLRQLPPVMDKPLYASHSTALALWCSFQTVVTLDTSFRQQGASYIQQQFRAILQNIRNANALQTNWEALMSRSSAKLAVEHNKEFDSSIHLFATNALAKHHNTKRLKQLHLPIAQCLAQVPRQTNIAYDNDDQLPSEILLSVNEQVMLIANLWIQASFVNGSLGQIKSIVYDTDSKPPDLPKYVVVEFKNYTRPHWDYANSKFVPIPPITRGGHTQIPLAMAWALTIHKSQGLTLNKATIDIGKTKKQGLTFTALSRVKYVHDLRIDPPFTFERYSKLQSNAYTTIRKKEENRLAALSSQISTSPPSQQL
ncbi:ATP-dependent DNA helicase PIF1-like [Cryptomeria japonica]|uniref:ATP-dependent DNA helicase PIF1-like n=1 Tax=Cryptomeria japonica TaxID=3369 RepID=UPI0027D9DE54|nr:ATP-dependent DNA helicase PIF1-like [Cryptomeria japonica]